MRHFQEEEHISEVGASTFGEKKGGQTFFLVSSCLLEQAL